MVWVYYLLLLIAMAGSAVATLFSIPGVWLLAIFALGYAVLTHFRHLGVHGLIALLILAAVSEIVEMGTAGVAAKAAGGSSRASIGAMIGAIIGGIVGTAVIPIIIVGSLIGLAVGAFIGALIMEQSRNTNPNHLFRVGAAAAGGRLLGTILKLIFAGIMFILAAILAFPWR
jgi:hypothetical protein